MQQPETLRSTQGYDLLFYFCCGIYLLVGVSHVFWGAISPMALQEMEGTATDLSVLLFSQFSGFLVGVLLTPVIVPRLGQRLHIALGIVLAFSALLVMLTVDSLAGLALAGAVLGVGGGSLETGAAALILGPGRSPRQLSILEIFFGLGALGFPLIVFFNSGAINWQGLVLGMSAFAGLLLISWLTCYRLLSADETSPGDSLTVAKVRPVERRGGTGWAATSLVGFAFVYAGVETNAANFLPQILGASEGHSEAVLSVSLFWIGIVTGRMLTGILAERSVVPPALIIMTTGLLLSTLCLLLLGLPDTRTSFVWITLMGFSAGGIFPSTLTMATRFANRPARTTTSFFVAAASLGGALISLPVGLVIDRWSGEGGTLLFALLCLVMLGIATTVAIGLRRKRTPQ